MIGHALAKAFAGRRERRSSSPCQNPPPWLCPVEHLGLVLSGRAAVAYEDGTVHELSAGTLFYVPAVPHDSWVIGDRPYVSLHFLGADTYAKKP